MRFLALLCTLLGLQQEASAFTAKARHAVEISERAVCPAGVPEVTVNVGTTVIYAPVNINTYYTANTVININGGVTINITNAPTFLSTAVTATITAVSTTTV